MVTKNIRYGTITLSAVSKRDREEILVIPLVVRIHDFVTLAPGVAGSKALADELIAHVRTRLSPHVALRLLEFTETMPVTATGKIKRRELRARELAKGA